MKIGNWFDRDRLITILLILAGIVLALVLFGAGAVWRGRGRPIYLRRAASERSIDENPSSTQNGPGRILSAIAWSPELTLLLPQRLTKLQMLFH